MDQIISTKSIVTTEEMKNIDGSGYTKTTSTIIETYSDGQEKTVIETVTETRQIVGISDRGDVIPIAKNAKSNAAQVPLTTEEKFVDDTLKCHNVVREKHGVPPLAINTQLCRVAQAHADKMVQEGRISHTKLGYGENFYWRGTNVSEGKEVVDQWYHELHDYDWSHIKYQKGTAHFTQVVWKASKELGVAKSRGKDGSSFIVVLYDPPGNVLSSFSENVCKPKE